MPSPKVHEFSFIWYRYVNLILYANDELIFKIPIELYSKGFKDIKPILTILCSNITREITVTLAQPSKCLDVLSQLVN